MSGLEVLGGIAAATQLFAYLLRALFELRDQIKHAPARVQAYVERLDSLRRTVQYIQDHPIFVTNVVEALLKTILKQVAGIKSILHKSFSREPRSPARRLIRLYRKRKAELQIRESLGNLESYKSDLMICISSTTERSTTGMLLEDGGISLETVTVDNAAVIRETVPAQGNGATHSQHRAFVASAQRSDTFTSTLPIESGEMHNSTLSVGSDQTLGRALSTESEEKLNSTSSTEREETVNSDRVDNSTHAEWQDLSFAKNINEENGIGAMGNIGENALQSRNKFAGNVMKKNGLSLMGNIGCDALSLFLKAGEASEVPLPGARRV